MKKRLITFCAIMICLMIGTAHADKNLVINLEISKAPPLQTADSYSFYIRSIQDTRVFGDPTSSVEVPSWGNIDPGNRTEEMKHRVVGRATKRGRKKEGNIFLNKGDVPLISREMISGALNGLGYSVVESEDDITAATIILDVDVTHFWGYFHEAFIGGSVNVKIETVLTLTTDDKKVKKRIGVSAKRSARYPQKPENWERVFTTAIKDYQHIAKDELRQ